ncbi:MAG: hypothetical protein JHC33_12815 [Ignisphaera sp.]|nr:hypothetical protein [Ignisphaera sp.]
MYTIHTELGSLPSFDPNLPCFSDIETDGLYINPRIFQIYQPETSDLVHILDFTYIKVDDAKKWLAPLWLVFFNASYDLGTLNFVPAKLDDMFFASKMAFPEFQDFGLADVCSRLGYTNYDGINKKEQQKSKWVLGAYLSSIQLTYASIDCIVLFQLWNEAKIRDIVNTSKAYKVDIYSLIYTIQWQENGMPVIRENYNNWVAKTKAEIAEFETFMPLVLDKFGKSKPLNSRSSPQVKSVLGTESSDKPTLSRLMASKSPLSDLAFNILRLRKSLNDMSKLNGYNFPSVKGRFNPYGTVTGRYNCSGGDIPNGINMQNYPRQFKSIFGATKADEVIIGADYATLELRLACMIYGEPSMYKALMDGIDLHKYTASLITNKPIEDVTAEERQNAKAINFGFTFGLSAVNFIEYAFDLYGLRFSLEEAVAFRDRFFKAYPNFKKYHDYVYKAMQTKNYICSTALGRQIKPQRGTDAINAPVQGSGSECTKLAIHYMVQEDSRSLEVIMNVIHDAIYLRVNASEADYWAGLLQRNMVKGWEQLSKSSLFNYNDIPMPVEVKIGKTVKDV